MLMFLFLYTEKAVPVRDTTTQVQKIIVLIILIAHLVDITKSSLFLMYHVWDIVKYLLEYGVWIIRYEGCSDNKKWPKPA